MLMSCIHVLNGRSQVYELGVEGRCLQALQLLDQLADVRVKIARWPLACTVARRMATFFAFLVLMHMWWARKRESLGLSIWAQVPALAAALSQGLCPHWTTHPQEFRVDHVARPTWCNGAMEHGPPLIRTTCCGLSITKKRG